MILIGREPFEDLETASEVVGCDVGRSDRSGGRGNAPSSHRDFSASRQTGYRYRSAPYAAGTVRPRSVLRGSARRSDDRLCRAIRRRRISRFGQSRRTGRACPLLFEPQRCINPKTVAKWKERSFVADLPTGPKQPSSTVLSIEEEAIVVAFRRHTLLPLDDCLYALQPTIPHLTRSSLHRVDMEIAD